MVLQDVNLIPILGAGWKIDDQATVTPSNRDQFMISYMSPSCGLLAVAKTDTPSVYAPPVGWHVIFASDSKGDQIDLWIEPAARRGTSTLAPTRGR
jgi:hypothetical protein